MTWLGVSPSRSTVGVSSRDSGRLRKVATNPSSALVARANRVAATAPGSIASSSACRRGSVGRAALPRATGPGDTVRHRYAGAHQAEHQVAQRVAGPAVLPGQRRQLVRRPAAAAAGPRRRPAGHRRRPCPARLTRCAGVAGGHDPPGPDPQVPGCRGAGAARPARRCPAAGPRPGRPAPRGAPARSAATQQQRAPSPARLGRSARAPPARSRGPAEPDPPRPGPSLRAGARRCRRWSRRGRCSAPPRAGRRRPASRPAGRARGCRTGAGRPRCATTRNSVRPPESSSSIRW